MSNDDNTLGAVLTLVVGGADSRNAEPGAFSKDEVKALEAMGHKVNEAGHTWGFMNVVSWDRKTGKVYAGADSRRASGSGVVK